MGDAGCGMSAVIPFPVHLARQARDTLAAHVAQAGKATDARVVFVRGSVRGHCHQRGYSDAVTGAAVLSALTQLSNGQTRDFALNHGCDLADRLAKRESDADWSPHA